MRRVYTTIPFSDSLEELEVYASGGLFYELREKLKLDASLKLGLVEDADDFILGLGITFLK